jgi:hypothetical protein
MIVPSLDMLANVRVNQWIAHLPEDHPLMQQHHALLGATAPINWTSSFNRHLAVCGGLRILLARGYDSLHYIKDDDLKLLSTRWSKGTDALDAALCSVGVFSRTPKRGSARHGRKQRMTASELVENAGVPDRFGRSSLFIWKRMKPESAMSIGHCDIKPLPSRTFGGSFGINMPA